MSDAPPDLTVVAEEDASAAFFSRGALLVDALYEAITSTTPLASHPSGELWMYRNGVYHHDRRRIAHLVTSRLGDRFKPEHLRTFIAYAEATLTAKGLDLAAPPATHLVNVRNGMLDPFAPPARRLLPHDPIHLSVSQYPVAYDAAATCPTFDRWLGEVLPSKDRRIDLLEDLGMLLDLRGRRQKKAVFPIGPTRSGKSTLARIVEAVVGSDNRATEELADLATNRFRAAQLFGRVLNVASDISAGHTDVGTFKKLTGEDSLTGEHKYGHPFSFRWHGLMLMTMNAAPSVSDASGAYLERVRPYRFGISFAGREDPSIEAAIIAAELPGVLNHLVGGLRAIERRNGYRLDRSAGEAAAWFARQSDRVRLFLAEATYVTDTSWTKRSAVHEAFVDWARDSRRGAMTRNELYDALRGAGIVEARRHGVDGFHLTLVADYDTHPVR